MPTMDKKQRKEKKREQKRKQIKMTSTKDQSFSSTEKEFGKFQLLVLSILIILISGFIFYQMN